MFFRFLFVSFITLSSLLSCAPTLVHQYETGKPIDAVKVDQIIENKTTEAEAVALLGTPQTVQHRPDGSKVLMYQHYLLHMSGPSAVNLQGGTSHDMLFLGIRDGIVKKKWQSSSSTPASSTTGLRGPFAPN